MEYGLREANEVLSRSWRVVLILVLMEYGLRAGGWYTVRETAEVLILVLMEYGLRVLRSFRRRILS